MRQELTIIGGHQSGKSYRLMRIAIEEALAGRRVMFTAEDRATLRIRYQDLERMIFHTLSDVDCKAFCANGSERFEFANGGLILVNQPSARGAAKPPLIDTHLIDGSTAEPRLEATRVIRTALR